MARLTLAIFLCLSMFSFGLRAFGGEWHSAGNAPVTPHKPSGIAEYKCVFTSYNRVGKKAYRIREEIVFADQAFRGEYGGVGFFTLKNSGDPGMDGQSFSLGFRLGQNQEEILDLRISARIEGRGHSFATFSAKRSEKTITGLVDLSVEKPKRGQASWMRVHVDCRDLN